METQIPSWLGESPATDTTMVDTPEIHLPVSLERRKADLALAHTIFDLIFDDTIDRLTAGHLLSDVVEDYNSTHSTPISMAKFQRWMFTDKERKRKFDEAMELGTHVTLDEMIRIADGRDNPMEDVARSLARVKVRERKLKAYNRKVFGDDSSSIHPNSNGPIVVNITGVVSPYAQNTQHVQELEQVTIDG